MTTSIDGLRRRVSSLRKAMDAQHGARQWSLELMVGEEVPEAIRARFGSHDLVVIREYPREWIDMAAGAGACAGTVSWPGGIMIVRPDGSLEPVRQDTAGRRRRR